MSNKTRFRVTSIAISIWCLGQVALLLLVFFDSPPTQSAELISSHQNRLYVGFFAFYVFTGIFFVVGAKFDFFSQIDKSFSLDDNTAGGCYLVMFYMALVGGLALVVMITASYPRYEIFVDLPQETITRREPHVLIPGTRLQFTPFDQINEITAKYHWSGRYYKRYRVTAMIQDGSTIELGAGPRQQGAESPPNELRSLAQIIADKSGAELRWR